MRGSAAEAHLYPPPHAAVPSISFLRWEPILGAAFLLNLTPTDFPAILTHFSVDMVKTRRDASTKVNVLRSTIWRHNWNVCLSVCLSVFISGCISHTSKLDQRDKLDTLGAVYNISTGTRSPAPDISRGGVAAALGRFGETLRKSYS